MLRIARSLPSERIDAMNFAFRPRLFSTVIMAAFVAIFLALGTWQMSRFFEKSKAEEAWSERRNAAPIQIRSLGDLAAGEELEHRKVELIGEIDPDSVAVFRHQRWSGAPGCWLGSPLTLVDGGTILAIRGFVPVQRSGVCDVEGAGFSPASRWTGLLHLPQTQLKDLRGREQDQPATLSYWDGFDAEGAYEAMEITERMDPLMVAVLAEEHTAKPYPVASFEHVTDPYLTSMRHLNYAGTWFVMIFVTLGLWGFLSLKRLPDDASA